ncbi:hypothetical protein LAN14_25970, partial [Mycobacterium tuberculosis]|nr:hypothetical protein [Mycobacterium tuberculosis]
RLTSREVLGVGATAASEFLVGQVLRVGAAGLTATFAVLAALACHRAYVLAAARRDLETALA